MSDMLPVEIESRQQAEKSGQSIAYRLHPFGLGQRRYDISRDQLEHLRSLFFLLAKNSKYAAGDCLYHPAKAQVLWA